MGEVLQQLQLQTQKELFSEWWQLADSLIAKWNDMRRQTGSTSISPTGGTAYGYPEWWAKMIGFSHDMHPIWVKPASHPPASCHVAPQTSALPDKWNAGTATWHYSQSSAIDLKAFQVEAGMQPTHLDS